MLNVCLISTFCSLFDMNWLSLNRFNYGDLCALFALLFKKRGKCPKLQRSRSILWESLSLYKSRHYKSPHTRSIKLMTDILMRLFWQSAHAEQHTQHLQHITQKGQVLTLTKAKLLSSLPVSVLLILVISSKALRSRLVIAYFLNIINSYINYRDSPSTIN